MSKVRFTVDDTMFRLQAKRLVKELNKSESEFLREQGALYARTMSKVTPPHAGGIFPELKKAGYQEGKVRDTVEAGKNAIIADMSGMFVIKSRGFLEFIHDLTGQLRNIRRTIRTKKGVPYVIDVDEINYNSLPRALNWHQSHRQPSTGRAKNRNQGSNDTVIGRWTARDRMWITPDLWKKVHKIKSANIGMSKAAFAAAAVKLGIKQKPPKYISKFIAGIGTTVRIIKSPKALVTIKATAPGLPHTARLHGKVMRFRLEAMVKRLQYLVRAEARKSGFKTRG